MTKTYSKYSSLFSSVTLISLPPGLRSCCSILPKTSKSAKDQISKSQLNFFRRHFLSIFVAFSAPESTTILKNARKLTRFCVQVALMDAKHLSFMGQVISWTPSCPLGPLKSQNFFQFFFFRHFSSIPPLRNHFHRAQNHFFHLFRPLLEL